MKSHGLIFAGAMVRALLDRNKTQTRRPVTRHNSLIDGGPAHKDLWEELDFFNACVDKGPSPAGNPGPYLHVPASRWGSVHRIYPRIQVGDQVWVRETWKPDNTFKGGGIPRRGIKFGDAVRWKEGSPDQKGPWKPSIFMPRWASRVTLDVTEIGAQRIQDISDKDCQAEGVTRLNAGDLGMEKWSSAFRNLWISIYEKRGFGWEKNLWVWVVEFNKAGK